MNKSMLLCMPSGFGVFVIYAAISDWYTYTDAVTPIAYYESRHWFGLFYLACALYALLCYCELIADDFK